MGVTSVTSLTLPIQINIKLWRKIMKFTDIKNKVKDLWEYDGEFIWTSNEFKWSRVSSRNSNLKTKNSYFLEFYNDSNDNFFRISDSDGNIVGFIDGNELRKIQLEERFCNFIFDGGSFMFSVYDPI